MIFAENFAAGAAPPVLLLAALLIDAVLGDLPWLFRRVTHPVALCGAVIGWFDRRLNRAGRSERDRFIRGLAMAATLVVGGWLVGAALADGAQRLPQGWLVELGVVFLLLAQRGLFDHVRAVGLALAERGVAAARREVAHIVGRDPERLDAHGVARAALESLAENFADAVVAPAFWYLLAGLPGLVAYKVANTMDSMVGHRTTQYAAFGAAAARLDDALNFIPARLAALLLVAGAAFTPGGRPVRALKIWLRDGHRHRSPNAGQPEAALAGAISVALSGPRSYDGAPTDEPWLGGEFASTAGPADIRRALYVSVVACVIQAGLVAVLAAAVLAG